MVTPKHLFDILVREHADMLTVYLRAVVRSPEVADDLFQETMLTAWKSIGRFDRTRPFGPWLRGIASKLILAHYRKNRRHLMMCNEEVLERIDQQMEALHAAPGDTFNEKLDALRDCIKRLPEKLREAVHKRYVEDITTGEAESASGINRETFKKRLQRARAELMDCLSRKGLVLQKS